MIVESYYDSIKPFGAPVYYVQECDKKEKTTPAAS